MIEHKRIKGLSFDDILLPPVYSEVRSRSEPDTSTRIGPFELGIPFISSPMDTVTESKMAKAICKLGGAGVIHRFMSKEDQLKEVYKLNDAGVCPVIVAIGVGEEEKSRLKYLLDPYPNENPTIHMISVDVANGHSILMKEMIEWIQANYPDLPIMAGNIATFQGYEFMADLGVAAVRVGVGGGCAVASTEILMANGINKRIIDVKPGDMVINKFGEPVRVNALISSGKKHVLKINSASSSKPMYFTADHKFWCGDLSNRKKINKIGKARTLSKANRDGTSKVRWVPIGEVKPKHILGLTPKNINFSLKESISIDMSNYIKFPKFIDKFVISKNGSFNVKYNRYIQSDYNLGYIFGTFIGDGHACLSNNKKSEIGRVDWYFRKQEDDIVNKLSTLIYKCFGVKAKIIEKDNLIIVRAYSKPMAHIFHTFGKKTGKHLPANFMTKSKNYNKGIYDGLIDSNGWRESSRRECISNTSYKVIELFNFCCMVLGKSFSNGLREPRMGGLKDCNPDNLNPIYTAKTHTSNRFFEDSLHDGEYSYSEILSIENVSEEVETWDLEVDCPTHSFVSHNIILSNSICKTRIQTGFGIPTLSSVVDCARARHKYHYYTGKPKHELPSIIADGGIRYPADAVKSIIGGADAVMCGGIFAGTDEAPGAVLTQEDMQVKMYRGAASASVQKDLRGGLKEGVCAEGVTTYIPYVGSIKDVLFGDDGFVGGLKSGMSYANARTIEELKDFNEYIVVSGSGINESHSYGTKK